MNFKEYIETHLSEQQEALKRAQASSDRKFKIYLERELLRREILKDPNKTESQISEELEAFDDETFDCVFKPSNLVKKVVLVEETQTVSPKKKTRDFLS